MITHEQFRSYFDVADKRIYLNHAAYAPLSTPVVQAMDGYFEHRRQGSPLTWSIAESHREGLRKNYGQLINAPAERVAMMANTVTGINILATGLDWRSGDHILLYAAEFPANVMPFLNLQEKGVEVEFLEAGDGRVTPDLFAAAIRPATRLISVSSVQYLTGYRSDLKSISELCHAHQIIFSVDAIQSVGVIPTDVLEMGIDFMSVGGHKWMMSPLGSGFLYVTEELQSRLKLTYRGYMGHVNPVDYGNFDQELSPDARRYELGAFNAPSIVGAEQATELLLGCDPAHIFRHVRRLLNQFEEGLAEIPFELIHDFSEAEVSGICLFSHTNSQRNEAVYEALTTAGVNLSLRGAGLRIAPHYYNTVEEITALLSLLKKLG